MKECRMSWCFTMAGLYILFIIWIGYQDSFSVAASLMDSETIVSKKYPACNIFLVHISKHGGTAVCNLLRSIPWTFFGLDVGSNCLVPKSSVGLSSTATSSHLNNPYKKMGGLQGMRDLMWTRWTNAIGMESGYKGEEDMTTFPTAHFLTHQDEWNDFKVVLSMRDPLEAAMSTFFFSGMEENGCHGIKKKNTSNLTLEEVSSCTPMTRIKSNLFGNFQCRFLSGDVFDQADDSKLKLAKKVVEKALIVNINNLEEVEEALSTSMKLSRNLFQTSEGVFRSGFHHDISGDSDCDEGLVTVGKYCMTPELHDGLLKANWCDLELLRHAREYHGPGGGLEALATCPENYRERETEWPLPLKNPLHGFSSLKTLQTRENVVITTNDAFSLGQIASRDDQACEARFQECLRVNLELLPFRQFRIHEFQRIHGPWLENEWIFRYSQLFVDGDVKVFCDIFGGFIPIFVQWQDILETKGVSNCKHLRRVHELLQRDFTYVTLASGPQGIVADCGFLLEDFPNLIVFSEKGYGQVPIPNLRRPPIIGPHPEISVSFFMSYCGFLAMPLRTAVMEGLEAGPDDKEKRLPTRKLEMSYTEYLNSNSEPVYVEKDCYNTWQASLFALILADHPSRRSSYELFDVLAVGTVPVYLYKEVEWLPYKDPGEPWRFGVAVHMSKLDQLGEVLAEFAASAAYDQMRLDIKTLYKGQFTKSGVFDRIEEFMNQETLNASGSVFEPLRIRKHPDLPKLRGVTVTSIAQREKSEEGV